MLQFLQREVCCDNQRLAASVSAVNYVVNLFKPVFRAALHAEIVKDKQGEAAKAVYVFVPALVAGGKVIEYQCKIRHAHGNLTLHECVGDTPGKIALSPTWGGAWFTVTFYNSEGQRHCLLSPL